MRADGLAWPPAEIVIATRSAGKGRELRALAAAVGIAALDLTDVGIAEHAVEDSLELFDTFEANARAKARHFAAQLPGRVVVADDSGLCVDALGGAPGARSKRWAGAGGDAANNDALLAALAQVEDRRAHYVCVVVAIFGSDEWVARGECAGRILRAPSGGEGFGYDPLFWSDELARGFGEVSRDEKEHVSHRARAFRALVDTWGHASLDARHR